MLFLMDMGLGGSAPATVLSTTAALNAVNIGSIPNDNTGDEPRAGFTKIKIESSHFLSAVGRRQTLPGTFGVTTSGTSQTVMGDTSQNWQAGQFAGQTLTILTGVNAGYSGTIVGNTGGVGSSTLTISNPINGSNNIGVGVGYQITPAIMNGGSDGFATALGGTSPSTVIDSNQAWSSNEWASFGVTFLAGNFAGQTSPIISNSATVLTLAVAFANAIAAGTPYVIGALPVSSNFASTILVTLSASQNDWSPTNFGPGIDRIRVNVSTSGLSVTGLNAAGFADGAPVILRNTNANNTLALPHLSASSQPANQFALPGGATYNLGPLAQVTLVRDTTEPNSSGAGAWTLLP